LSAISAVACACAAGWLNGVPLTWDAAGRETPVRCEEIADEDPSELASASVAESAAVSPDSGVSELLVVRLGDPEPST
jgi:hypothetical protein